MIILYSIIYIIIGFIILGIINALNNNETRNNKIEEPGVLQWAAILWPITILIFCGFYQIYKASFYFSSFIFNKINEYKIAKEEYNKEIEDALKDLDD